MITQKIIARTDSLKLDKIISRYGEDSMRQVVFIIVRPDPDSEELIPITIPEDAVGSFRILKPSGNFVIVPMSKSVLASGETAFDVVLPASANTAKGSGYYDIRITSNTDKYYFTAQGDFLIDDNIISDEVLEDVSEVNGLVFPDDFFTIEDHVAYIDDDTVSTDSTWSSDKISEEIEAHAGGDVSKTVYGNPVTFDDGAGAPLVKCVTQITGYQQGSGTPSPDNIRPIVAYTEGEIEVRGKNAFDGTVYKSGYAIDGNGAEISASNYSLYKFVGLDGNNILSFADTNQTSEVKIARVGAYDEDGNPLHIYSTATYTTSSGRIELPFDASNSAYVVVSMRSASVTDVQIEEGSTATPYEPYLGTTHTTTYPSAIYRGSEDVVNGEVTSEWPVIDLGSKTWSGSSDGWTQSTYIVSDILPCENNEKAHIISDRYETETANVVYSRVKESICINANKIIQIYDSSFANMTGAQIASALQGSQLAYELATPTTSSVTPTNLPIKSLSGYTHIESTTGDMEVEYITQRFQPLIDSIKQL